MRALKQPVFAINIPNILTVIRILLTPLFVILLQKGMYLFSLYVFAIAGISDGLDGFIARYFNQRTVMGAYLDPIADKLLLMASFVSLAIFGFIPEWLTIIVISRDIIIVLGIAIFSVTNSPFDIKPTIISKLTTFAQLSTIFIILLTLAIDFEISSIKPSIFWITAIITIVSGFQYIYIGLNILQASLGNSQETDE